MWSSGLSALRSANAFSSERNATLRRRYWNWGNLKLLRSWWWFTKIPQPGSIVKYFLHVLRGQLLFYMGNNLHNFKWYSIHHVAYLNDPKDSFIPTGFQGLPALIWIEKPYEVNSTDVPSMVAMTHPLCSRRGEWTRSPISKTPSSSC